MRTRVARSGEQKRHRTQILRALAATALAAMMAASATAATAVPLQPISGVSSMPRQAGVVAAAPGVTGQSSVILNMFQWTWNSVAAECASTVGPAGYGYVQVSPPQEHIIGSEWWTSYQPVSYKLDSKLGTDAEFRAMVTACDNAGVGVIVDAVINHMTGQKSPGVGFAGTPYSEENYPGPEGQYGPADFHACKADISDYSDASQVQNCRLVSLQDLDTGKPSVQQEIADYLDKLADAGVAGFRIDAAKHISAADLLAIKNATTSAKNLYWVQEVIGSAGEPIAPTDYLGTGDSHEFNYARGLKSKFDGKISQLEVVGTHWGLLDSRNAGVFVDNHDTERNGETMNYKWGAKYKLANMFMLSYPYGSPSVYTGYEFEQRDAGAPQDSDGNVLDADCGSGVFTCVHRAPEINNMVAFNALVQGSELNNWQNASDNFIGYGRGAKGFVALNNTADSATHTFTTALPAGTYCNIVSSLDLAGCAQSITVADDGTATITVPAYSGVAFDVDHATLGDAQPAYVGPTTVYYPARAGWTNTYLHHGVGSNWTQVPGDEMTLACDGWVSVTVNRGGAFEAVVNDGGDFWDKNAAGQNFELSGPVQTIRDGNVYTSSPCGGNYFPTTVVYYQTQSDWETYNIHFQVGFGQWTTPPGVGMSPACTGWVKRTIDSKGSDITAAFNDRDLVWDSNGGANYSLNGQVVAVGRDGVTQANPCEGQEEAAELPDLPANLPPDLDVDRVVIYYAERSDWTEHFIHYGVAGAWTAVPGVLMEPACPGWLTHTIEGNTGIQVTFNDNTRDWDSNGGANYKINTPIATISNGVMTAESPCEPEGTDTDGSGTDGSGTDGTGTDGSGTDGSGTDGSGTDGSGSEGTDTEGSGSEGTGTEE